MGWRRDIGIPEKDFSDMSVDDMSLTLRFLGVAKELDQRKIEEEEQGKIKLWETKRAKKIRTKGKVKTISDKGKVKTISDICREAAREFFMKYTAADTTVTLYETLFETWYSLRLVNTGKTHRKTIE